MQTPSACRADCHMGLCACAMWFVYVRTTETTAVPPTKLRDAEQLSLLTAFVCGGGETGNEIMLRDPCAQGAYRRAGPDQEENTNHLLADLAGLMEMRNSSFSVMYQSKVESVVTPGNAIFPLLSVSLNLLLPLTHSILPQNSLTVTKYHCETAHTKVTIYHSSTLLFLIPKIPFLLFHFELQYLEPSRRVQS